MTSTTTRSLTLDLMLGGSLLLAACGEKAATNGTAAAAPKAADGAEPMGNMAGMEMRAATTKIAKGSGTVVAIDAAKGKITFKHGPIPEAGWPAMTMAFDARPDMLAGVAVGDEVAFDLALKKGAGEVVAIHRQ